MYINFCSCHYAEVGVVTILLDFVNKQPNSYLNAVQHLVILIELIF